jgi:hypothetical protein
MSLILSGNEASPWKMPEGRAASRREDVAALFESAGLEIDGWVDATRPCWILFRERLDLFLWGKALDYELDEDWVERVRHHMYGACEPFLGYFLLKARKK